MQRSTLVADLAHDRPSFRRAKTVVDLSTDRARCRRRGNCFRRQLHPRVFFGLGCRQPKPHRRRPLARSRRVRDRCGRIYWNARCSGTARTNEERGQPLARRSLRLGERTASGPEGPTPRWAVRDQRSISNFEFRISNFGGGSGLAHRGRIRRRRVVSRARTRSRANGPMGNSMATKRLEFS